MFTINHNYRLAIINSDITTSLANGTQNIYIEKSLIIEKNNDTGEVQFFTNINRVRVLVTGSVIKNVIISLFNENDELVHTIRLHRPIRDNINVLMYFRCAGSDGKDYSFYRLFDINDDGEVKITVKRLDKVIYGGNEYDISGLTTLTPLYQADINEIEFIATNYSLYKPDILLYAYMPDGSGHINITQFANITQIENGIKLSVNFPIGELYDIQVFGNSISVPIIIEGSINYSVNGIYDGEIDSINRGDSITLTFKSINSNYILTPRSVEPLMSMIEGQYEYYSYNYDISTGEIVVEVHGVIDTPTFVNMTPQELEMDATPTVTKTFTAITVISESQVVYGSPYEIKFRATNTADKTIRSVVAKYGGEDAYYTIEDGVVTIYIPEMLKSLVITASAENKYTMTFNVTTPAITFKVAGLKNKILFKKYETFYRIVVNGNDSSSFNIPLQTNEKVVGLSIDGVTVIPFGIEVDYMWNGTSDFELVKKIIPQPSQFTMNLYQLSGEKNLVDKTNVISSIGVLVGTLRTGCDMINPVIEIEYDTVPDFNYVYIPNYNRYYFVTNVTVNERGLWTISLHVDVLMSFKDEIRANTGVIARNEKEFNNLIEDTQRLREKDDEFTSRDITTTSIFEDLSAGTSNKFKFVVGCIKGEN